MFVVDEFCASFNGWRDLFPTSFKGRGDYAWDEQDDLGGKVGWRVNPACRRGTEEEIGVRGAAPAKFLKMRFYPLSGPRWRF